LRPVPMSAGGGWEEWCHAHIAAVGRCVRAAVSWSRQGAATAAARGLPQAAWGLQQAVGLVGAVHFPAALPPPPATAATSQLHSRYPKPCREASLS
jgi:hypothetical protein